MILQIKTQPNNIVLIGSKQNPECRHVYLVKLKVWPYCFNNMTNNIREDISRESVIVCMCVDNEKLKDG